MSEEITLLDKDHIDVSNTKSGTLFVEARIHDEIEQEIDTAKMESDLQIQLSRPNQSFDLLADLLVDEKYVKDLLGPLYKHSLLLQSLKVVEYMGPKSELNTYSSNDVRIKVQVYKMYHARRSWEEHEGLPQAEITQLPHIRFDGQWDALCFEADIKSNLIWMMTNMLHFSQTSGREPGDTSPLILLHGPPGTGKTTLCQGLAQKISIRLNETYKRTSLIQIKAAALLSKYYSESARQIDTIFTTLQQMCEDNPEDFICVLIDEVETIAISREASAYGESQESLRATNAFLTGLDRTKGYANIVFLCTSNMVGSLDVAFMDRCGLKHEVESPSLVSQYAILRCRIQRLVTRGIILPSAELPTYRDANADRTLDSELPGSKLLHIIELIDSAPIMDAEEALSGRYLTQLPEQALLRYLRGEDCDLDRALRLIERYVMEEQSRARKGSLKKKAEDVSKEEMPLSLEGGLRKRDAGTMLEEDNGVDRALLARAIGVAADVLAAIRQNLRRMP